MRQTLLTLFVLLLVPQLGLAKQTQTSNKQDQQEVPRQLTGHVEFGFVGTTGNTQTNSLNGGLHLNFIKNQWQSILDLKGIYSSDSGNTTSQRFSENLESKYFLGKKKFNFLYGLVNGVQDEFGTYNPVWSLSAGYGDRLFKTDTMHLDAQIGPGGRFSTIQGTNETRKEFIVFVNANYHWDITKKTEFEQDLSSEVGSINTSVESTSSLKTKLIGNLALDLSYNVRYNSNIPKRSSRTHHYDTTSTVSVLYSF